MPIKIQDDSESPPESWAQSAQVNGMDRWIKAFPTATDNGHITNQDAMDLRDYFAAQAMQAMIAHPNSDAGKPVSVYANNAYIIADAMMEARK